MDEARVKAAMKVIDMSLSELQIDALTEVANIGIGNATSALAELLDKEIRITVPRLGILPVEKIPEQVGGMGTPVVGVCMSISGGMSGYVAFVFEIKQAYRLIELLTGGSPMAPIENPSFDEMGQSVLMEIGNILASSCINAIAQMTDLSFRPTPPVFACDMAGAVVTGVLLEIGQLAEEALVITVKLLEAQLVDGIFLFIPEPESLKVILNALGVGE